MTGAMYAAIGGLQSHMSRLNVIGNNIANVNTYGYKKARMTFRESIYTTRKAGSDGNATTGGNNPSQVGYGSVVGSIDLNMNPSTYAPTGFDMDCMIMGEGFFLVGDKTNMVKSANDIQGMTLTRVGDFTFDSQGYLCDRAGQIVYGFATVQNPFYNPKAKEPLPTASAEEKAAYEKVKNPTMISTQLTPLRLPLMAAKPDTTDKTQTWAEGDPVYPVLGKPDTNNNNAHYNAAANGSDPLDGAPIKFDGYDGTPSTNANTGTYGTTSIIANTQDKCVQLNTLSIGKDGCVTGIDDNDNTVVVGYVAVANVDSPSGVTHINGPYYKALGGAGQVRVACLGGVLKDKYLANKEVTGTGTAAVAPSPDEAIMSGGSNTIENGGLESSSTDVAEEFANMITTQRGYQANTRIVTVTDSMLEELVNMKR